jgi:hypothetical protein
LEEGEKLPNGTPHPEKKKKKKKKSVMHSGVL